MKVHNIDTPVLTTVWKERFNRTIKENHTLRSRLPFQKLLAVAEQIVANCSDNLVFQKMVNTATLTMKNLSDGYMWKRSGVPVILHICIWNFSVTLMKTCLLLTNFARLAAKVSIISGKKSIWDFWRRFRYVAPVFSTLWWAPFGKHPFRWRPFVRCLLPAPFWQVPFGLQTVKNSSTFPVPTYLNVISNFCS